MTPLTELAADCQVSALYEVAGFSGTYRVASMPSITGILRSMRMPSKRNGFSANLTVRNGEEEEERKWVGDEEERGMSRKYKRREWMIAIRYITTSNKFLN
jgi:hypothetical protein